MKIFVLSVGENIYSTKRLVDEAEERGPLLIEVNASPGLQGVEAYTKVNIAEHIIKFIENNVRKRFPK